MQSDRLVRHLKFRELNYLVTLGRISSIHRAAALHGISQPALSKTLRELESILGFKIFERSRRGVTPTKLGEIVIAQAVQMISNLDALDGAARCRAPWPPAHLSRRRHAQSGAAPDPRRLHAGPGEISRPRRRAGRGEHRRSACSACGAANIRSWSRDPRRRTACRSSGRRRSIRRWAWWSAAPAIRPPAVIIASFSRCCPIRGCCRSSDRRARRSSAPSCAPAAIRRCPRSSTMRRSSSATC